MMESIKHSVEILTQSKSLALIVNKVEQLSKLNRLIHEKLNSDLSKHCRVANLRDGILILSTTSPATGHLLRFAESDLLTALRAEPEWCHLKSIKTQVHPLQAISHQDSLTRQITPLNPSNREIIANIAKHIDCPSLQQALQRLACSPSPTLRALAKK